MAEVSPTSAGGAARRVVWLALALLALGAHVAVGGPGPGAPPDSESSAPFLGWLPGATPEDIHAMLVMDLETGAPIAGAKVSHFEEDVHPTTIDPPLLAEATTDERGLAVVDARNRPGDHWIVDAPGYAATRTYGFDPDPVYALSRGRTVRGRLVDPLGAPLVGAPVGLFVGCPHGPTIRRATTDADGRFALEHVPLHYAWDDGWDSIPTSLSFPRDRLTDGEWFDVDVSSSLGEGVATRAAETSFTMSGVVVDPAGRPVEGCVVRSPNTWYRRATTGRDGRFALAGLARDDVVSFFHPAFRAGLEAFHRAAGFHPGYPLRVVFPPDGKEPDAVALDVTVRDAATKATLDEVRVWIVDVATGAVDDGVTRSDVEGRPPGSWRFETAPGTYDVFVESARGFDPLVDGSAAAARVEVKDATPARVEVPRRALATVPLEVVAPGVPEGVPVVAVARGMEIGVSLDASVEPPLVPAEGPVVLRAALGSIVAPVAPLKDGKRRVEIAWPAPKRIVVPVPDRKAESLSIESLDGADPTSVDLRPEGRETVSFETRASGRLRFRLVSQKGDDEKTYPAFRFDVTVPDVPGAEVKVEASALRPLARGVVKVLLPDGSPAAGTRVSTWNDYPPDEHRRTFSSDDAPDAEPVGDDGSLSSRAIRTGVRVAAHRDHFVALRRRLDGDGPWTLKWGSGAVRLRVASEDLEPLEFAILLDGWLTHGSFGALDLQGLEPGFHDLIVGAAGHVGRVVRIRVPENGAHDIHLLLPRRGLPAAPEERIWGRSGAEWGRLLLDPEPVVEAEAAKALDFLPRSASAAAQGLIALLSDPVQETRRDAGWALELAEPVDPRRVPALIEAVRGPDPNVRRAAMAALGRMGPRAAAAVDVLVETLEAKETDTSDEAARALANLGAAARPAHEALSRALRSERSLRGDFAADLFARESPDIGAAAEDLIAGASSHSPGVRAGCLLAIGRLNEVNVNHVLLLVGRLSDEDEDVRLAAVKALAEVARKRPEEARSGLAAALSHVDVDVRLAAARAFSTPALVGPKSSALLLKAIEDPSDRVRVAALDAIGEIRAGDPAIEAALLVRLEKDPDEWARAAVARAFATERGPALTSYPALRRAAAQPSALVRVFAALALATAGAEGEPDPIAVLTSALDDEQVGFQAALALATLGERSKPALPRLAAVFPAGGARGIAAAAAMRVIGGDSEVEMHAAVSAALLSDDLGPVVARFLARLGPAAEPWRAALLHALAHGSDATRVEVPPVLLGLDPAVDVRTPLEAALLDPSPAVRSAARAALEALGRRPK